MLMFSDDALRVLELLERRGYKAYIVGGAVRDMLRGIPSDDIDFATNALPQDIFAVFADYRTIPTGLKHGTVTVVYNDTPFEITTFRKDGEYNDRRHPSEVQFTSSVEDDLARRDFTVNAMAFHPIEGIIDPFGGKCDLEQKVLRCVGDARKRFNEDALRIARLLRFMSVLDFEPETTTKTAAQELCSHLDMVAAERKQTELCKMLLGDGFLRTVLTLPEPFLTLVPHLRATYGFAQHNPHHHFDVYEHTVRAVAAADKDLIVRLALLLHDIGKPETFSVDENNIGHFYGHAAHSETIAKDTLTQLRFSNSVTEAVLPLIRHHGDELIADKKLLKRRLSRLGEIGVRRLIEVKTADASACLTDGIAPDYTLHLQIIADIIKENACLTLSDLAIDGHDLMQLGFPAGPLIGTILHELLDAVINEECCNTPDALTRIVKERWPI